MRYLPSRPEWPFFFICIALTAGPAAKVQAADFNIFDGPGHWSLAVSPYTQHFRYSAEHKPVWALGLERERDDGTLGGAAYFRNSFGQPSAYVYLGHAYRGLFGVPQWTAQWSVGVLYGYRGKYESKVPLNVNGFAPGALLSTGWQFDQDFGAEVHLLGDAGVMLQLNFRLK